MSYYPPEFHSLAGTAEIRIKAARPGGTLRASWLFLAFWALGAASASAELLQPGKAGAPTFLKIWLLGWLVGGLSPIGRLGWYYLGEEVISLANGALCIRQQLGWLHRDKTYDVAHIISLRAQDAVPGDHWFGQRQRGPLLGQGAVLFDYGARTVAFGLNLLAEGSRVAGFLHRHHVDAAGR